MLQLIEEGMKEYIKRNALNAISIVIAQVRKASGVVAFAVRILVI
jgi:hypothetical protein